MVAAEIPQVEPLVLPNVTVGGLAQPQDTWNAVPVVIHPDAFFTAMEWVPLATFENETPVWKVPPSRL
jgi:hypothetical protein